MQNAPHRRGEKFGSLGGHRVGWANPSTQPLNHCTIDCTVVE